MAKSLRVLEAGAAKALASAALTKLAEKTAMEGLVKVGPRGDKGFAVVMQVLSTQLRSVTLQEHPGSMLEKKRSLRDYSIGERGMVPGEALKLTDQSIFIKNLSSSSLFATAMF